MPCMQRCGWHDLLSSASFFLPLPFACIVTNVRALCPCSFPANSLLHFLLISMTTCLRKSSEATRGVCMFIVCRCCPNSTLFKHLL